MGLHPAVAVPVGEALDPDLVGRELVALDPVLMVLMGAEVVALGEAQVADLEDQVLEDKVLVLVVRHMTAIGPKGAATVVQAKVKAPVKVVDLKDGGIAVLIEAHLQAIRGAAMIAVGTTTTGAKVGVQMVDVAMARHRVTVERMPKSRKT